MNSGRTAEFLEIHNNTVQYRLKKANEILGAEMTANRVIPGLTLALALKRLEEEN
jgi:DNA-binding PucR family transcriptional regulator